MIPKKIFQTHSTKKITLDIARSIEIIKSMNPEYEYIFHDDQMAESWIRDNTNARVLKAYQDLLPVAFKAEVWRYCVLYEYGGIHIDCKMIEQTPLREVIRSGDEYIITSDFLNCRALYTAVLAFSPKHPFLLNVIEGCVANIEKRFYGNGFFDITSTIFLANKYRKYIKNENDFKPMFGKNFQIWEHNSGDDPNDLSKYTVSNPDRKIVFLKQPPGYTHEQYDKMWYEHRVYRK